MAINYLEVEEIKKELKAFLQKYEDLIEKVDIKSLLEKADEELNNGDAAWQALYSLLIPKYNSLNINPSYYILMYNINGDRIMCDNKGNFNTFFTKAKHFKSVQEAMDYAQKKFSSLTDKYGKWETLGIAE